MTPLEWMMSGDTGTSSETILSVMEGAPCRSPSEPADPGDFGRCHRLLQHFPLYRLRLPEVAAMYPVWTGLVREWDELTALYEAESPTGTCPRLYERMQVLRDEGMLADGWRRTRCGWTKEPERAPEDRRDA